MNVEKQARGMEDRMGAVRPWLRDITIQPRDDWMDALMYQALTYGKASYTVAVDPRIRGKSVAFIVHDEWMDEPAPRDERLLLCRVMR